ncbi:MAG: polyprenol monophosphomannose synthase [Flavobacteriales bacterium]
MEKKLVVIPTYNEKENVQDIITLVMSFERQYHILIVDDGSPDGTADLVKALQSEYSERLHLVERTGKLGLGTAYICGFKWAIERKYDYIFEMDCDFSHKPQDLDRLLDAVTSGSDVAVGSRYINNMVNVVNWPMTRVLMSFFASKYVKFITRMPIFDATAGFMCYKREVLERIGLDRIKFVGYAFQIEMKFTSWKHGFKIAEVPVVFTDRVKGSSKMSMGIFKEAFFGVLQLKWRSWFRDYKKTA